MSRKEQAQGLLDNELLIELIEEFDTRAYQQWRRVETTLEEAERIRARAQAAQNLYLYIRNRAEVIAGE